MSSKIRTAKKEHTCECGCGKPIPKGMEYYCHRGRRGVELRFLVLHRPVVRRYA